jgi:hypothetical protein
MDVLKRFALIRADLLVEARYWDLRKGVCNGAWVGIDVSVRMLKYLGMDLEEKDRWGEDTSKKLIEHAGFEEKVSMLCQGTDKFTDPG